MTSLHSTMSLLKPSVSYDEHTHGNIFTFHYVSIKTSVSYDEHTHGNIFTFHYVSIKTQIMQARWAIRATLHSTMSLLKRRQGTLCFFITSTLYIPLCLY